MAGEANEEPGQLRRAAKLCWTCEGKVQAERRCARWGVGNLLMVVLTAGLWVPLRMMYHAVASPWRCVACRGRIEAWHKCLGRAAAQGFGGLTAVWLAVPAFVAVMSSQPNTGEVSGRSAIDRRSADGFSARSANAIVGEKLRREAAAAEFLAKRDQIVSEIRGLIEGSRFEEAVTQAARYRFLDDTEVNELHAHARKKAEERRQATHENTGAEREAVENRAVQEDRFATGQKAGLLSIEIERYQNTADSGANFKVINPTGVEYDKCSIELGDSAGKRRWFLPNPTVLDAQGLRSYPTFLFRDREGITPPTATAIRYALIKCSSPTIEQEFDVYGKTASAARVRR